MNVTQISEFRNTHNNRMKSYFNNISQKQFILFISLSLITLFLLLFVVAPLWDMLRSSVLDSHGYFVGLANFNEYFLSKVVWRSLTNTLVLGVVVMFVVGVLAFFYAYALTRSCIPYKKLFKILGMAPILVPSLLPVISLIYLFGKQGIATEILFGHSIYGFLGVVLGLIFWIFPHALIILSTSLRTSDARLYESAKALKISSFKTFFIVTLPAAKYGLVSTFLVIFTLAVCDFGVATVIGESYNVLATDIFKQVVGQQNFSMAAVTSFLLLLPALLAFFVDNWVQKKQKSLFDSNSVPYQPSPELLRDSICFGYCLFISIIVVVVLGMAIYGSLVTFWPWNKALSFNNYNFAEISTYGWTPFWNSLKLASWTALFGTLLIFIGAYSMEKGRSHIKLRRFLKILSVLPMAVPGMVLGLGYIVFFNDINNPLNFLYGSMLLLVLNTIVHYYTVAHMTAIAALKQLPVELEASASSIKLPQYKLFWKVTLPVCLPAVFDIADYLFINALTTTSAVVFLYSTDTIPASISVLNMDDAGQTGSAAAMAVMIMLAALLVKFAHLMFDKIFENVTQAWRKR